MVVVSLLLLSIHGSGKGQVTVNGKDIKEYFGETTVYPAVATRPMQVVDAKSDFDVSVNVYGGGPNGR